MATSTQYNSKCAGVKRLMREAMELAEPTEMFFAQPMEDNLFEWHFTVRGPLGTKFDGGVYHGKIIFPSEYPMKPPNLIILTPNGRFELNKKICLSISGYHPETWLPSWSVRTALLALIGFMPSEPGGALGSLNYPEAEIKTLAKASLRWSCSECGLCMKDALKPLVDGSAMKEAKELAGKLIFKNSTDTPKTSESSESENVIEQVESVEETRSEVEAPSPPAPVIKAPSPPVRIRTSSNTSSSCDFQFVLLARRAYM
ncbi:unnamed protein product [Auanema sp. JU1783]|nr:unnamed protein product [Auanema sp. JU1783]